MPNASSICLTPDCSGRGACMVPAGATNNISICVCDFPWSGMTDILNYEGYDCVDLGILRQIFYAGVAVTHVHNLKYFYLAYKCQWKVFKANKGKRRKKGAIINHWWQMLSFKVLILLQLANIAFIYIGVAMVLQDGVIGGSLLASMVYVVAAVLTFSASVPININTLTAMLAGAGMGSKAKPILRFVHTANITALALYSLCLVSVFTFLPLYATSTTESPNESVVVPALLVFRNVIVCFYFVFMGKVAEYISSKVSAIIAERTKAGKSGKSSSAGDDKMERLLNRLDLSTQASKKKSFVIGILYGIFCLPWMHPYQGYLYGFTLMQGAGSNHPARLYISDVKATTSSRVGPSANDLVASSATTSVGGDGGGQSSVASSGAD